MCFGDSKTVETKTSEKSNPAWLDQAAQTNLSNAAAATSKPFEAYTGDRVAGLSPDEQTAGGMLRTVAGSGNPYTSQIEQLYGKFANTPGATISAPSIIGPDTNVREASLTDYMSPYIMAALQPQLEDIARSGEQARKRINTNATFGGAFGDSRHGVEAAGQIYDENRLRSGAVGQGYQAAFDRAGTLRGQDISNLINTDKMTADYGERALDRSKTGGDALRDLDRYNTGREVDLANQLAGFGAKERGIEQAQKDADFQEFMRKQGYSSDMIKLFTSVLAATPHGSSEKSETQKPDNSGFGMLGSILGAGASLAAAPFTGGMSLAALPAVAGFSGSATGASGNTLPFGGPR